MLSVADGILIACIAAAVGSGFTAALWRYWNQRYWIHPLRSMIRTGSAIVQADWRGQVPADGSAEVRHLIRQFNQVAIDTQRRLAELQHRQADLRALVDTLPDPILASDRQGRLILMNAPALQLLGLSSAQALGQKVVSIINDEQVVELFEKVAALPQTPSAQTPQTTQVQREVRLTRGGQKLTCQAVAAPTDDGGALVVLRDVSTLARAIQMKTDFVANASHELRTPIAAIKIAFETLQEAFIDDPQQAARCMTVIDANLARLEEMLRDLLDLSRVEGPALEPAAVIVRSADIFSNVRGTLLAVAQRKVIELVFDEPDPREFIGDARLLNLIVKNLVENSIKYTPVGGKVTVSLTSAEGDVGRGDMTAAPVVLTVADTGIGIAPEHIDRVFERFYQVDSARPAAAGRGTGLGLAIVKHAVSALGGTVKLESQVNVGTTVICVFPQPPGRVES